jgi:hypothetical protein
MTKLTKPIHRLTNDELSAQFGADKHRPLVASFVPGGEGRPDTIELRPYGTRRAEVVAIVDVYHFAIRARVNLGRLEKARERKLQLAASRERARIARADAKIRREAREQRLIK